MKGLPIRRWMLPVLAAVAALAVLGVLLVPRGGAEGHPLAEPRGGWADRHSTFNRGLLDPRVGQCPSGTFIDYTDPVKGYGSPVEAIRFQFPGAGTLRVQPVTPDVAVVEVFQGSAKQGAHEVFRTEAGGWIVMHSALWSPCGTATRGLHARLSSS